MVAWQRDHHANIVRMEENGVKWNANRWWSCSDNTTAPQQQWHPPVLYLLYTSVELLSVTVNGPWNVGQSRVSREWRRDSQMTQEKKRDSSKRDTRNQHMKGKSINHIASNDPYIAERAFVISLQQFVCGIRTHLSNERQVLSKLKHWGGRKRQRTWTIIDKARYYAFSLCVRKWCVTYCWKEWKER